MQDHWTRWTDDGWVEPDSFAPNTVQPTGRKRRAGGRSAVKRIPDGTVLRRDNQCGIPQKRALFVSDGPDSTTSGSDILEGHYDRPPEEGYSDISNSGRPHDVHVAEELCSPSRQLQKAVVRLQPDIADYSAELKLNRTHTPAVSIRPLKRSGFTSTSVPRFSGKSSWEQYRQVFEAIVRSNGWDNVTAALQLLSHLDGDALNVALLVPESQRVLPGFLVKSLSDYYSSPGRLAKYKRQFQRAFRRPGDDPSIFAIELETLARRAFVDIDPLIQLQMERDRFIDGQAECALRRHLDSLGPDTPMADIVDCCRVWESHIELASSRQMGTGRHSPRAVCQVTEDKQSPVGSPETESLEDIIRKLLPARPPLEAAPIPSGPISPHSAINGSDTSITAGGAGTIEIDRFGDHVTELASGRNGGGRRFAEFAVGFSRGVFFMQGLDPHDRTMSDTG